jgi:hypothetical protein
VPKPAQAHEPEVPVKVREWIRPALASPDLVLEAGTVGWVSCTSRLRAADFYS